VIGGPSEGKLGSTLGLPLLLPIMVPNSGGALIISERPLYNDLRWRDATEEKVSGGESEVR